MKGHSVPDLYDICIKLQLKGLNNLSNTIRKKAEVMTPQILHNIHQLVDIHDEFEVTCFTALLTSFFLLLRKSNLIPDNQTSKKGFDPTKQLQRGYLKIGRKTIVVDIKWSKAIQRNGQILQLPLLPLMTKELCPMHWIKTMTQMIPAQAESPLFIVPGKKEWAPLTYHKLDKQLKVWAGRVTGSQDGWTLHCLRWEGCFMVFQC